MMYNVGDKFLGLVEGCNLGYTIHIVKASEINGLACRWIRNDGKQILPIWRVSEEWLNTNIEKGEISSPLPTKKLEEYM